MIFAGVRTAGVTILSCALALAGCAPLFGGGRSEREPSARPSESDDRDERETARDGVFFDHGAVVLTGIALEDGPGNVLAAMTGKVPNFRVLHQGNTCPEISLRSHVNYTGFVNPHVYVDGTRATDTCILESLRAHDVSRVEVYPLGFTTRPGYGRHAHGLILVFMRSG
jgi:hypothetical protein